MVTSSTVKEGYVARQEGGRMYYHKQGKGEPLVMVGGVKSWSKVIDEISQHFTCYAIDPPSGDRSDIPRSWLATRKWTLPDYTSAILETLDGIGIKQAIFTGGATNAMISLDIAANHPHRVKKLVLDALPFWNLERGAIVWERWFSPMHTDTTSYDVPVDPLLPPYEEMKKKMPDLTREEWKERDEERRRRRRWQVAHEYSNTHFDSEALGPKVKVPTLLIYGEKSALIPGARRAHEAIMGSILKIVPGYPTTPGPGAIHGDKPEEYIRLALDFLLGRK